MPNPYIKSLAKASIEFPLREDFLSSLIDVEDREPASLKVFATDKQTEIPLEDTRPIAEADFVHIQSVQMPQEERAQILFTSADEGKLITYGRATRMYAISGFLVDSNSSSTDGRLMTEWDDLYEHTFRMTQCLKNRRLVRFRWRKNSLYGYLLSNIKGMESTQPSVCMVNFTFLAVYEDYGLKKVPVMNITDEDIQIDGAASYESLSSLNLLPNLESIYQKTRAGVAAATGSAVGRAIRDSVKGGGKKIVDTVGRLT